MTSNIAIIGGGVTGLLTAAALNQQNISASVYEQGNMYQLQPGCTVLHTKAIHRLHELGLLRSLLPYVHALHVTETFTPEGLLCARRRSSGKAIMIENQRLQQVLQEALAPTQLQAGKQCVHVNLHAGEQAMLYFADGTYTAAETVIGADGRHSFVRKNHFPGNAALYAGYVSWNGMAVMDTDRFAPGSCAVFTGKGRRFKILALPGNKVYWQATVKTTEAKATCMQPLHQHVRAHFDNWCPVIKQVLAATKKSHLHLADNCYPQKIKQLVQHSVLLAGDAAHPMVQDADQGLALAIEDAVHIASLMTQKKAGTTTLAAYEKAALRRIRSAAAASVKWQGLNLPGIKFIRTIHSLIGKCYSLPGSRAIAAFGSRAAEFAETNIYADGVKPYRRTAGNVNNLASPAVHEYPGNKKMRSSRTENENHPLSWQ